MKEMKKRRRRPKASKLSPKVSKKRWSYAQGTPKDPRVDDYLATMGGITKKNLRSCHPSLLYPKSIGSPEWVILNNT
jgi:hypothetical protein